MTLRNCCILALLCAALAPGLACRDGEASAQKRPGSRALDGPARPVTGVRIDFPAGWTQESITGPFSAQYRSDTDLIDVGVGDSMLGGSMADAAAKAKARLTRNGATVLEESDASVDGRAAYRILTETKNSTVHNFTGVLLVNSRSATVTSVFATSSGDARPGQDDRIRDLLARVHVDG